MFVVDLDPLFCEHGHVPDIIFIAVMEFMKFDGVVKFFDLGLVRLLTKFAPHGIQHHFSKRAKTRIFVNLGGV